MCDHATLQPPAAANPGWPICAWLFPGRPDQIGVARALLIDFLGSYPAADDAVLLISELATNAVVHSASGAPEGTFTIRAHLLGNRLRAEVEDGGSAWDGNLGTTEAPHGLYLLRALSATCGTIPGARGWITWFTLTGPAEQASQP